MRDRLMERLRELLIGVASTHSITYYGEVAPQVGMIARGIGPLLGRICEQEVASGGPMLSAVVVARRTDIPGPRFFELAKKLGRYNGTTDADAEAFFERELCEVHKYWGN